jgi:hypothetical protein
VEFVLAFALFVVAFGLMGAGVLLSNRQLRGSCGGGEVIGADGAPISCGACPRKENEVCPSDDPLIALAQIGHPDPSRHH